MEQVKSQIKYFTMIIMKKTTYSISHIQKEILKIYAVNEKMSLGRNRRKQHNYIKAILKEHKENQRFLKQRKIHREYNQESE